MARRWLWGIALLLLINLWGLRLAIGRDDVSADKDTLAMVQAVKSERNQLNWFRSDWPLKNGFYRPIPAVSFALDSSISGENIPAYRLTNWVIATACSILLAWFIFELFRNFSYALICGSLLAGWQTGLFSDMRLDVWCWVAGAALLGWALAPSATARFDKVVAGLVTIAFGFELVFALGQYEINSKSMAWRIVDWPPGRTASIMTLFGLICLAAYCRSERSRLLGWQIASWIALLAALLCYEQAIVLFGCLLGCSLMLQIQHVEVRWPAHLFAIAVTVAYLFLHRQFLSEDTAYRLQQARSISGGVRDLFIWLAPVTVFARQLWPSITLVFSEGIPALLISALWAHLLATVCNLANVASIVKKWNWQILFGLAGSVGAYSVLAFQHPFAHYYYFAACFRSIYVLGLGIMIWRLIRSGPGIKISA